MHIHALASVRSSKNRFAGWADPVALSIGNDGINKLNYLISIGNHGKDDGQNKILKFDEKQ